ncbi:MAG TPA: TerB family tellurite resistance protein [Acetobacteraceae bacterium]|nr:TerB family tellurite resistance protein [Acetobacteraceae bacterium]
MSVSPASLDRKRALYDAANATWREQPATNLMLAIVTAAAVVACADGVVRPAERRGLVAFLHARNLLPWFGPRSILDAFNTRAGHLRAGPEAALWAAVNGLRSLTPREEAALVASAAAHVAVADGGACPREMAVLGAIRQRLGLARVSH